MTTGLPQPGTTVAGKYVLESMLGQGGMGAVFRARHALTDRKVALKWMLPDERAGDAAVQRFLREAKAMGRIDHPSVVGVLDVGLEADAAYLVMELLRGQSLRDRIDARGGRLAPSEAIAILLPAMEGVAAAHAAGVVHRDLKPDNLFCVAVPEGNKPITKVLDFGVSKLQGDRFAQPGPEGPSAITHTGAMVGTPAYMAPEQVRGVRDLDGRTDVWALGAILYEALAGRGPFAHETLGQIVISIATAAPPRLESLVPDIPVALADVVHRALEKPIERRWPDVATFARALEPFGSGVRFTAPVPTSVPPIASGESSAEIALPRAPKVPSEDGSVSQARTLPSSGVDVHVSIDGSAKTSGATATPYVSTADRLVPPMPSHRPWLIAGGLVIVVVVVVGAAMSTMGPRAAAPPPSPAVPASEVVAVAPDAWVSVVDAAVFAAPPPTSTIPLALDPPPTTTVATERPSRRPRATATTTTAPTTTVAAPPRGGRTGTLSAEDF